MKKNAYFTHGLLWLMALSLAAGLIGCTLKEEGKEKQPAVSVTEEEKSFSGEKSLEKEKAAKTDEQKPKDVAEDKKQEDPLLKKDTSQPSSSPISDDDDEKAASVPKTENVAPAEPQQSPARTPSEPPSQESAPAPGNAASAPAPQNQGNTNLVWIPASGAKYHSYPGCSNMKNPTQVTQDEAVAMGYDACKRCH